MHLCMKIWKFDAKINLFYTIFHIVKFIFMFPFIYKYCSHKSGGEIALIFFERLCGEDAGNEWDSGKKVIIIAYSFSISSLS